MKLEINTDLNEPNRISISEMPTNIIIDHIKFESPNEEKAKLNPQGKCLEYAFEVARKNPGVEIIHGVVITVLPDNNYDSIRHAWNRIGDIYFDVTAEKIWKELNIPNNFKEFRYASIESYQGDELTEITNKFSENVLQFAEDLKNK